MSWFDDNYDGVGWYSGTPRALRKSSVECKRCGKPGLRWSEESTGWVLMEGRYKVHRCDMTKAAADDFDEVKDA